MDDNGRTLAYNYTDEKYGIIKGLKIVNQKNDMIYLVIYVGPESGFNAYLPTAQKMIKSINIFDLNLYE